MKYIIRKHKSDPEMLEILSNIYYGTNNWVHVWAVVHADFVDSFINDNNSEAKKISDKLSVDGECEIEIKLSEEE
jgi:hypothetical protein